MKARGRRHSPGEKLLMKQVSMEFRRKKEDLGAKQAALELGVSLASFYKYVAATDLPRMEILRKAHKKWGIQWRLLDSSQFVSTIRLESPEQRFLPFLDTVQEKDVEVSKIKREGLHTLQIALKIRFSA